MTFAALHLPTGSDFTGFPSIRAARKYVRKYVINAKCGKGKARFWQSKYSKDVQWCEWVFISEDALAGCEDLGDVFDNAYGFRRVK